jgi:hypothetical protein
MVPFRAADEAGQLTIESTHYGLLFDDSESTFIVRDKESLAAAKACVADRTPVYAEGRMALEGWKDRSDPLLDGAIASGVDFDTQSIVIVGGKQCKILSAAVRDGVCLVTAERDLSQTHGREYCAVVVSPPVPADCSLEVEIPGEDFGASVFMEQRAMVAGPMVFEQRVMSFMPAQRPE